MISYLYTIQFNMISYLYIIQFNIKLQMNK